MGCACVNELRGSPKYLTKLLGGSNELGALDRRQAVGGRWG